MRILKLQFTNINSLAGTWHVDFTGPAYMHGGIFAITGPTGAGKSTILDAICLALYGCTPRLKSISMNENEAMTRQTAVCSAEVTFQTQAGLYRCTWSQRRAHGKPDGNLQQPKHEIVDAATGTVIESQIRKVAAKIVEVTGMDVDQFTRSMLLAQGKFATFLYADANERGPVLEQITGTEIYSRISMYVYERWAAEKKELEKIAIELTGMGVMSEGDRAARHSELESLAKRSTELISHAETLRSMLAWHQHVAKLQGELSEAEAEWSEFERRNAGAESSRTTLARAEQASALEGHYLSLLKQREEAKRLHGELGHSNGRLPSAVEARDGARQRLDVARAKREELRQRLQSDSGVWKKTRELDATIREKRKTHSEYLHVRDERRDDLDRQTAKQQSLSGEFEAIRVEKEKLLQYFETHSSDAALAGSMAAIALLIEGMQSNAAKLVEKRTLYDAAGRDRATLSEESEGTRKDCERDGQKARDAEAASSASDARLGQILCGREVSAIRSLSSSLAEQERLLEEVLRIFDEMNTAASALHSYEEKRSEQAARQEKGREHVAQAERVEMQKQKEVDHCSEIVQLQRTIDSLVDHRAHLKDGVPCPLCGSPDHPYASGQVPRADEKLEALERAKTELKAASVRLQHYTNGLARIDEAVDQLDALIREKKEQIEALSVKAEKASSSAGVRCEASIVSRETENVRERKQEIIRLVNAADAAIEARDKARREADEAQKSAHASQLRYEQTAARLSKADEDRRRLEGECDAVSKELDEMLENFRHRCAPYNLGPITVETLGAAGEALKMRNDAWEQHERMRADAERRESVLVPELKSVEAVIENLRRLLEKAEQDAVQCGRECETLEKERTALYGGMDPDEEERGLNEKLAGVDLSMAALTEQAERCAGDLAVLEKEIAMKRMQLDECGEKLIADEKAFGGRLTGAGFSSEEEFVSLRLSDEERARLQNLVTGLRDEGKRLESVLEQKRLDVKRERDMNITNKTSAEISTELKAAEAACADVQQAIGALESQLRNDEDRRNARTEKQAEQEKKQREYRRWDGLNELIGSANGKKFQKIAQSVTFEMMVAQANKVLRKMSPRYFLVCDPKTDLEMNIVDQYQAGEVRSTKNLSGGESFIVSLSLALGLSHMASRNVRVDSLFLDEGFGTLDEEALDVALTTLSELQQEGKTIGVISHVGALKERISTQIVVTPESGGRSTLSGPGCRRIN